MSGTVGDTAATRGPSEMAVGLAEWAACTADRVAVRDDEVTLTFAELDALTGTLARELVDRVGARTGALDGTGDGGFLPLLVGHDAWSVVAIHGAVRAGVPFALINASLPRAALDDLLGRLHAPFAVAGDGRQGRSLPRSLPVVEVPRMPRDPVPPQDVDPSAAAFVLFTSGSTGRPKGVVHDWDVLDLRVVQMRERRAGRPRDHSAGLRPFYWLGGFQRVLTLAVAESISIKDPVRIDPLALLDWMDAEQFTKLQLPLSLFVQLIGRWPEGRRLESVREVRTGGEALLWEHVPGLQGLIAADASIVTGYGTSEAAMDGTRFDIWPGDPIGAGPVPLGWPVSEDRVRLVPVGDEPDGPSELVVRGKLALRYLDDPELTAARFGVDADGTRWWRSGDLAIRDDEGCYHHVGRTDTLVKIRGKLAEPAEPERVLHSIAGVRRAVVLPHETEGGVTRLVAHIEIERGSALTPASVRAALAAELAPHLVPSPLVRHDALPLTANGKIDRVALRDRVVVPWVSRTAQLPGATNHDELVAAVAVLAAQILELDDVPGDADLWELGLDSLGAVELTAACSALGDADLESTAVLDHPTPARLAQRLRADVPARASDVVVLNSEGTRPPLFCVPGAGGTALAFRWLADELGDEQPVVVIEAHGLHTHGAPDRSIGAAAARVVAAIDGAARDSALVVLGHSAGAAVAYETAHRLGAQGRPARVVLVDPAFPGLDPPAVPGPDPGRVARVRARRSGRTAADVLPAARRRVGNVVRGVRVAAYTRRPGPPRADPFRYEAFVHIGGRAVSDYSPPVAAFPVTVLHRAGSPAADAWSQVAPALAAREVPGGHLTMLRPPHAAALAHEVAAVLDEGPFRVP